MIKSFATPVGKSLFEGNWSIFADQQALSILEECFLDLRILDAAAVQSDLECAFKGRLEGTGGDAKAKKIYTLRGLTSENGIPYAVKFAWNGNHVDDVEVALFPMDNNEKKERRA